MKPTLLLTALFSTLISVAPAAAYQLKKDSSGAEVRWKQAAHFIVDAGADQKLGDEAAFVAIQAAVEAFAATAPGLEITVEAGKTSGVGFDFDRNAVNRNEIVVPDEWVYDEKAIAVTIVTLNVSTHEIVDADIAFNTRHRKFKVLPPTSQAGGEFDDIQNALTHELGHAVGLAHNAEEPEAVMYPGARKGEITKRVLVDDDVAGLLFLYPDAIREGRSALSEDELANVGCSAGGGQAAALLVVLVAPLFAVRRKRSPEASARVRPSPSSLV